MPRRLIAVMTCHANHERTDVIRGTWLPRVDGDVDVRFFYGRPPTDTPVAQHDGGTELDCEDDYKSFPKKVLAMLRWASDRGYERLWKVDDDVYVIPERLRWTEIPDYFGRKRGPSYDEAAKRIYGSSESSFCSGFGYSLSSRAIDTALQAAQNGDWAEDRFIGNALFRAGIRAFHDPTVMLWPMVFLHNLRHLPRADCPECFRAYSLASILCPHEKHGEIPRIHEAFISTGKVPLQ